MTGRERFLRVMNFEKADRLPMLEWATWWDKTVDNWKGQGLHIDVKPGLTEWQSLQTQLKLDLHLQSWYRITSGATPQPKYHGAPLVKDMDEYAKVLPTLYPADAINEGELKRYAAMQTSGEGIVWITLEGFFWGPRVLLGIEPHLFAFYDQPELYHRICEDICAYNLYLIDRVCDIVTPDFMTFAEDMSYNNGPMIGKSQFDEFMLPYYRRIIPELHMRGIRVFVDSDGDIELAAPWFDAAGIEGILPLERQAGVDLYRLRQRFPKMLFIGHFDKMCMNKGEGAMRAEFERLLPLMKQGGFAPSVDHQTPPGVDFAAYKVYLMLFREYAERAMEA